MTNIKNLFRWIKKFKFLFFISIILSIISILLYSYMPLFSQYIFNEVLDDKVNTTNLPHFLIDIFELGRPNKNTILLIVALALILFCLLESFIKFLEAFTRSKLRENIAFEMRNKLFSHILDLPYSFHNNCDTGDLIQRCSSDVDTAGVFVSTRFASFITMILTIVMGSYQLFNINLYVMLLTLLTIPINGIISVIFFKKSNKLYEKVENAEAEMTSVVQENIKNTRVVKAFSNEAYEVIKMEKKNLAYLNKALEFNKFDSFFWGLSNGITSLQFFLPAVLGIILAKNGLFYFGDMVAIDTLIGMVVWPMKDLGRLITDFSTSLVASNRIQEILDKKSEYLKNGTQKPLIKGNIKFKDVYFKFKDSDKPLLDKISFEIKAHETVAFIGKTGSGKSTILNLLTRLTEANSGEIYIDDININEIEKRHLRKNIGVVLQEPFLYTKSIYENISITNKLMEKSKVYKASSIADINDDILEFENGYDTLVGEKGVTLSGGQKQRVAIARILAEKRPIIIFDDSLSAVDTLTDVNIRSSLKKHNVGTTILITHRIMTAKEADKIIVIENGKISAIGTHDELKAKEGLYKTLWDIQGSSEKEFLSFFKGCDSHDGR